MKKKMLSLLTAAVCFAEAALTCTAASQTLAGDADCDGRVDVSDAVLIARFAAEDRDAVISDQGRINADVTYDGCADAGDTARILQFIAKQISYEELAGSGTEDTGSADELRIGYGSEGSGSVMTSQRLALRCRKFCEIGKILTVDAAMGDSYGYYQTYGGAPNYNTPGHAEYEVYTCSLGTYERIADAYLMINGGNSEYKKEYAREDMQMLDISPSCDDVASYHHENIEIDFSKCPAGSTGNLIFWFRWAYEKQGDNPYHPDKLYSGMSIILGYYVGEQGIAVGASSETAEAAYRERMADAEIDFHMITPSGPQPVSFPDLDAVIDACSSCDLSRYREEDRAACGRMLERFRDDGFVYALRGSDSAAVESSAVLFPYAQYEDIGIGYYATYREKTYHIMFYTADPEVLADTDGISAYLLDRMGRRTDGEVTVQEQTVSLMRANTENNHQLYAAAFVDANHYYAVNAVVSEEEMLAFLDVLNAIAYQHYFEMPA
ncbi:MAG: dockerin type I repeat-containing protein [Oscillospiraceae bacterium]|nr:dockerin type I repeat-containing protein [Oscillospiraceae bacterium]